MRRYWIATFAIMCVFLLMFFLTEYFELLDWLKDPVIIYKSSHKIVAVIISILLLIADVFLPIPGSLIMIGNGMIFGLGLGTIVSVIGGLLATSLGYYIGTKGKIYFHNFVGEAEARNAALFLEKWGVWAIIISRPIPIISETVSILSGVARIPITNVILYTILGYLPSAFIYALTGVYSSIIGEWVSLCIVVLIAGIYWLFGKLISHYHK